MSPELPEKPENLDISSMQGSETVWEKFATEYEKLIKSEATSLPLFAFLRRNLSQHHLNGFHTEAEVLSEVYLRAYKRIHQEGVEILKPAAWTKVTALNVIREWRRKTQRCVPLEREIEQEEPPPDPDSTLQTDLEVLKRALQQLDAEQQELLNLKIVQGLSWKEIQHLFALRGKTVSEEALRQQKARALKKLRQTFRSLRPLFDL